MTKQIPQNVTAKKSVPTVFTLQKTVDEFRTRIESLESLVKDLSTQLYSSVSGSSKSNIDDYLSFLKEIHGGK